MMPIEICNLRTEKIKYMNDVMVSRKSSMLGNPFHMLDERGRDDCCDRYEEWFNDQIEGFKPELLRLYEMWQRYRGLRLFCWCAPKRCHAETIKRWLESYEESCLQ
jgi:hypothetical protein